jgi:RNA polymerase sigma factor (sigma-70 family)
MPRPRVNPSISLRLFPVAIQYHRTEIREQVNAALAKLSPQHRAVVVLKELEDLQYHEIAEGLNLSIGTLRSRLFYAKGTYNPY